MTAQNKAMYRMRVENNSLKETLAVMSDKKIVKEIKTSLKEIASGKTFPLKKL